MNTNPMSTTEVAEKFNIPSSRILYHIQSGNLTPPRKKGRFYQWKTRDINRLSKLLSVTKS